MLADQILSFQFLVKPTKLHRAARRRVVSRTTFLRNPGLCDFLRREEHRILRADKLRADEVEGTSDYGLTF